MIFPLAAPPGACHGSRQLPDALDPREGIPIRLRGLDIIARPELIGEPDRVERLLARIIEANPAAGRFVRIPRDADGRFDRGALETAIRHGFRIVRRELDPDDQSAPAGMNTGAARKVAIGADVQGAVAQEKTWRTWRRVPSLNSASPRVPQCPDGQVAVRKLRGLPR